MNAPLPEDPVASLGKYDWKQPCCEVMRLRDPLANLFDRWCIVHHHWLTLDQNTERYYAEMEAARNTSEEAFFGARPELKDGGRETDRELWRALFRSGFERAFRLLWRPDP